VDHRPQVSELVRVVLTRPASKTLTRVALDIGSRFTSRGPILAGRSNGQGDSARRNFALAVGGAGGPTCRKTTEGSRLGGGPATGRGGGAGELLQGEVGAQPAVAPATHGTGDQGQKPLPPAAPPGGGLGQPGPGTLSRHPWRPSAAMTRTGEEFETPGRRPRAEPRKADQATSPLPWETRQEFLATWRESIA
jgi:hypothetical protein